MVSRTIMVIKILRKVIDCIKLLAVYYPYPILLHIFKNYRDEPQPGPKHYVLKDEKWIDDGVTKFIQGTGSKKLEQIIKEHMVSIDPRFVVEKKIVGRYFKGGFVIDVGIGHRPRMIKIKKNAMGIVNFDITMLGLQSIKKYYPSGNFVCGDALKMPFADSSFSFVYVGGVIAHITNYKVLINEIHRVLEPGGYLLLIEANEPPYRPRRFQDHVWNFTIHSLKKIVKENNFDIIDSGGIGIFGLENLFNSLPTNIRIKMGGFLLILGKLFPMSGHEVYILGKKPKSGEK